MESATLLNTETICGVQFVNTLTTGYGKVYFDAGSKTALCVLTAPYVPIEKFRELLEATGEAIVTNKLSKFVFDKSSLRSFHQPSMEWYFVHWKTRMYEHGLKKHRKLMPSEDWFMRCVEAGRAEILQLHPDSIVHQLDIRYVSSIEEAMSS